jgi:hypothetical protein
MPEKKVIYLSGVMLCLVFLLFGRVEAQQAFHQQKENPFYERYQLEAPLVQGRRLMEQELRPQREFTAVAFTLSELGAFAGLYAVVAGDSLPLRPAVHRPEDAEGIVSELLVFDSPQAEIYLAGPIPAEGLSVHFLYAPAVEQVRQQSTTKGARKLSGPCEQPEAIPQSVWRAGLPVPDYNRSFNEVDHLIIHHAATGNHLHNYTNVVRNIYLYHTEVNGWSDIGYNYLIAQDGSLFTGRDPAGGAQDNVRGAHFCGQNGGTMGVCLLGDYTQTEPAAQALQSLEHLLSWKSMKESLAPTGQQLHPANARLPVIAGHQDGCNTACPGRYVYDQIPGLRNRVGQQLAACEEEKSPASQPWVYFAPRLQEVCLGGVPEAELSALQLFDIQGREVSGSLMRLESQDVCFKATGLKPGIYFVQAERGSELIRKKFIIF